VIALCGATLCELKPARVRRATLILDGAAIAEVRDGEPPPGAERIDCAGALVLPGLVCGHTHLYSALARGMPPPEVAPANFTEILERVWWRLDRALDDEAVEVSALWGAVEAARAGVTTVVDHHASPAAIDGSLDRVGGALERVGLRGILCYEVTDRGGADGARAGIRESERFLQSLGRRPGDALRPLLRGMVGAHAGFTLGHDSAVQLADLAQRRRAGIHIHVAEDACDARHLLPGREGSIVDWLDAYRLLGPRALLAHCVHVDDEGAARIVAAGAHVAHNPRSNMNNAVGYARPARFGAKLVLGTDGIGADVLAEAQAGFFAARAHGAPFDPLAALAAAQSFAAAAFDAGIGRLEAGCPADLAVFGYRPPTPLDAGNLFGHLVFGLSTAHLTDLFVAGKPVMRARVLLNVDEEALAAKARDVAARLWKRMAAL
jgi:putative selenium metabolism protein SsnA